MRLIVVVIISSLTIYPNSVDASIKRIKTKLSSMDEETTLKAPAIIARHGYPIEVHYVVTADGYILQLHRIPYGLGASKKTGKIVYLQHGMLTSSACYVLGGPRNGLAYILADAGFDVWMGNVRGNTYSRNHTTLNPNRDSRFWDFSWHEIGVYDVPASLDYITEVTGQDRVFYIGHSLGTTVLFVMTSELPQYNDRLIAAFNMAPVAYMNHLISPLIRKIAFWHKPIKELYDVIGLTEFLPNAKLYGIAGKMFCEKDDLTARLCSNAGFMFLGFNRKELNATLVPIYFGHIPAGASVKTIFHYGQEIQSGKFRQYDEGLFGNLWRYQRCFPPEYALEEITAPMYLFYSRNDWFSSEIDVLRLTKRLVNAELILIQDHHFNHADYLFGISAPKYVYEEIIKIMHFYL